MIDWLVKRWRLARLRWERDHLDWRLRLWPDEDLATVLEYKRDAVRMAEEGRLI